MNDTPHVPLTQAPDHPEDKTPSDQPKEGMALCMSGGGFRATLFHAGVLWRLNLAGVLPTLERISSVSGGSITSGMLGLKWSKLGFDAGGVAGAFEKEVVGPLRDLCSSTVDVKSILSGLLCFGTIAEKVANAYRLKLFGKATLQDLPDHPHFVINATSIQTGSLWRFSKKSMGDWQVGLIDSPRTELAVAVGASSAFPPVLSPVILDVSQEHFTPETLGPLCVPPFTRRVVLSDGGVYDNMGLETIWKRYRTVLVSDAGGKMSADGTPSENWVIHSKRVLDVIDNQVGNLRKRQVISSLKSGLRKGAYWGIRTNIQDYALPDAFACPFDHTTALANIPTRLAAMTAVIQDRLINWGFAVCDAALRKHVDPGLKRPSSLPYPSAI